MPPTRTTISYASPGCFLGFLAVAIAACRPAAAPSAAGPIELLVLAPHPDDEVLMAGALMAQARGKSVVVAIVTNGTPACSANAFRREHETLAALSLLGISQDRVHFLGYPDGNLDRLGSRVLAPPSPSPASATCSERAQTTADNAAGIHTVSALRLAHESPYQADSLIEDMAWLLTRYRPKRIVTAHFADDHPDHAATGYFLLRALERAPIDPPELLLAVVHSGWCWPGANGDICKEIEPKPALPMPALPGGLGAYAPILRVPWPAQEPGLMARLIATYPSQFRGNPATDWLQGFVRSDAMFFANPMSCASTPDGRRCADVRTANLPVKDAPSGSTLWATGHAVLLGNGTGIRFESGNDSYRLCRRATTVGEEEILLHRLEPREALERRVRGETRGDVQVAWIPETPGVVSLDLSQGGESFARRLLPIALPLRVRADPSCADAL